MRKHRPIHKLTYMHTHAYVFMLVYAHAYTWGPCISLLLSPPVNFIFASDTYRRNATFIGTAVNQFLLQ